MLFVWQELLEWAERPSLEFYVRGNSQVQLCPHHQPNDTAGPEDVYTRTTLIMRLFVAGYISEKGINIRTILWEMTFLRTTNFIYRTSPDDLEVDSKRRKVCLSSNVNAQMD